MFLFIVGIQPRTTRLEKQARICPRCGRYGRYPKRTDHYFSLFFIPLFRVKRGIPFVACDHCHSVFDEAGTLHQERPAFRTTVRKCPDCGRSLEEDFEYCPRCGNKVMRP